MLPREQMCDPKPETISSASDPEDGLTGSKSRELCEQIRLGVVGSWDSMWRYLFPSDKMVPRPGKLHADALVREGFLTSHSRSSSH